MHRSTNRTQLGFIAQELETYIPEAVISDSVGYKAVDYSKLVATVISASQNQQVKIESQKQMILDQGVRIQQLKDQKDALKAKLNDLVNNL